MGPAKKKKKKTPYARPTKNARYATPPDEEQDNSKTRLRLASRTQTRRLTRQEAASLPTPESPQFPFQQQLPTATPASHEALGSSGPPTDVQSICASESRRDEAFQQFQQSEHPYLNVDNAFVDEATRQKLIDLAQLSGAVVESASPEVLAAARALHHDLKKTAETTTSPRADPERSGHLTHASSPGDGKATSLENDTASGHDGNNLETDVGGGILGFVLLTANASEGAKAYFNAEMMRQEKG